LTAVIVLAAGAGTRMGGVAKALLRRGEQTFLERIVDTADAERVIVVVGPPFGDAVAAHAHALGATVIVNQDPARGMSSSINLGFAALTDVELAWLWPVDHPDVTRPTLDALVAALGSHAVARPVCDGRGGHPPLVRRTLFAELARCAIAREVLNKADRVDVAVEDRGTIEDIDR
jgi:molybdenum cofactor cytidylyltransferase